MRQLLIVLALVSVAGSGSSMVVASPPPPPPDCKSHNTGSVSFQNRSDTTTQDVFWDNAQIATLTPGQSSSPVIAAAGVAHDLKFYITNTRTLACGTVTPILVQCGEEIFYCAYP